MIIRIILCIILMVATYYIMGALFTDTKKGVLSLVMTGFLTQLAVFSLVTLPCVYIGTSMKFYGSLMMSVTVALCVVVILKKKQDLIKPAEEFFGRLFSYVKKVITFQIGLEEFLILFAILLIAFQTVALVVGIHIDDDDSFYVATAVTSIDTDTLYRINPYTGAVYSEFPARYVLSPWPMYGAVWSFVLGIRPAVVFHTVFPAVLIPLAYVAMYLLGRAIWKDDPKYRIKNYGFMVVLSFLHIFAGFSTWSMGMRLLIRVWQGKIVLASVILIYLFGLMLSDWESEKLSRYTGLMLFITMMAGCFVSSMGVVLTGATLGCLLVARLILTRNIRYCLRVLTAFLPNLVLGGIYLMIK